MTVVESPAADLINADLAPTAPARRTWTTWNFAALWVSMSVCIPTYMLAASMVAAGLGWRECLAVILLGNAIVLVPMWISGDAGARYGIPFPVFVRASYGPRGAHLPAVLRSLVACGWFGIQTWIGGLAISALIASVWPRWAQIGGGAEIMGHTVPQFLGFFLFWAVNMYFVWAGTDSIKWLETLAAPFLLVMGLALLGWAVSRVGGLGAALAGSDRLVATESEVGVGSYLAWLTAMVGYWATLALNIPDFTRYARSPREQGRGQAIGLLTTMPLFAFIGIAVTGATVLLYDEAIWNPVDLLARLSAESRSPLLGAVALLVLAVATLSTNIAANVVSPANAFSNLAPGRISFRLGGLIAGAVGIAIFPWLLLDRYQTWLLSYSGLLGAVGGVVVGDYLLVRRGRLAVDDLYRRSGAYAYERGVNRAAMVATGVGIALPLVGRLVPALAFLFSGAWFSGAIAALVIYYVLMKRGGSGGEASA
ncbi:MAG: NCS1 family nucleobase:cation symporter-1 [Thermoanaerobaculia bacterium]|nr:NCS1 family nucleobase:cation symporter-1 [Thermoanaerobaculia bacterium]